MQCDQLSHTPTGMTPSHQSGLSPQTVSQNKGFLRLPFFFVVFVTAMSLVTNTRGKVNPQEHAPCTSASYSLVMCGNLNENGRHRLM